MNVQKKVALKICPVHIFLSFDPSLLWRRFQNVKNSTEKALFIRKLNFPVESEDSECQ